MVMFWMRSAMSEVPLAPSFAAFATPSIAFIMPSMEAKSSSDVALKSDTRPSTNSESRL